MSGIDDRLERDLELAAGAAPDPGGVFEDVWRRRAHRTAMRKTQTVALVAVVLLGTGAGFLTLQRNFTGAAVPGATPTSSAPSPSTAPAFAPIAIPDDPTKVFSVEGLAFQVCHSSRIEGNFLGTGPTYAYVFTKASDAGCLPSMGTSVVAVQVPADAAGTSATLVSGGPLDCQVDPPVCAAWANPDINRDGQDEIAIVTARGASTTSFELYEATHTSNGWGLLPFIDDNTTLPMSFPDGGSITHVAGEYCDDSSAGRRFVSWEATSSDGSTYDVTENIYTAQDMSLTVLPPKHMTSPADELIPSGFTGCGGSIQNPVIS